MAPTRFKWIAFHTFLIAIDRSLDRQAIARAAAVDPGTYSAEIVDRMLCCVFNGLVDVAVEFANYYQREYGTLERFLERRYAIAGSTAEILARACNEGQLLARGYLYSGGDYAVVQWIESDAGWRVFRGLLHLPEDEAEAYREQPDEDQE